MDDQAKTADTTALDRLGRLGLFIARYRWPVIGAWIVLTLFGALRPGSCRRAGTRASSVPGKPAYEASQRTLKALGAGVRPPNVVVFHSRRRRHEEPGGRAAMERAAATHARAR